MVLNALIADKSLINYSREETKQTQENQHNQQTQESQHNHETKQNQHNQQTQENQHPNHDLLLLYSLKNN